MNERSLAYSEQEVDLEQATNVEQLAVARIDLEVVDSLLHPQAILIRKVLTRPGRMDLNLILIDDEENILQALDAGVEMHSLYYAGGEMLSTELTRKLPHGASIHEVSKRTCKKLFENDKTSRVFALARTPSSCSLDSILEIPRDLMALEDLTISGNIGAIIRTSLAFGAGALILLNTEPVDIYDRRLIRASRGHVFALPILTATTEEFLRFCEQSRIPILVMAAQADQAEDEAAALPERLAIVLGSEKYGCSESLMKAATLRVRIPTHSRVESLNVSTVAGIMLYNRLWFNHPQVRKGSDL
jgi:23S rRNA (adenosine1067-2'-O)-methyltransferase